MRERCSCPRYQGYDRYGGRGIKVCERWQESFEAFLEDVGLAPSPQHSLGRIDNDGNYEPGNVTWQTVAEQSKNRAKPRRMQSIAAPQEMPSDQVACGGESEPHAQSCPPFAVPQESC